MEDRADEQQRAGDHAGVVAEQQTAQRGGDGDQSELHDGSPGAAERRDGPGAAERRDGPGAAERRDGRNGMRSELAPRDRFEGLRSARRGGSKAALDVSRQSSRPLSMKCRPGSEPCTRLPGSQVWTSAIAQVEEAGLAASAEPWQIEETTVRPGRATPNIAEGPRSTTDRPDAQRDKSPLIAEPVTEPMW